MSCLLYHMVSCLMNASKGECLCLREISIIVNKSVAVLLLPVLLIRYFLYCTLLLPLYFLIPLLLLNLSLLVYFFIPFFYTFSCDGAGPIVKNKA